MLAGLRKHLHFLLSHEFLQSYCLPPPLPPTTLRHRFPAEIFSVTLLLGVI